MTGFDTSQIVSDPKHYGTFLCKLCQQLVTIDAVVTPGNHLYCRSCLVQFMVGRISEGLPLKCPMSGMDLEVTTNSSSSSSPVGGPGDETTTILIEEGVRITAESLEVSQPLAFQCLQLVQVQCEINSGGGGESGKENNVSYWTGNYGDMESQLSTNRVSQTTAGRRPPLVTTHAVATTGSTIQGTGGGTTPSAKTVPVDDSSEKPVLFGDDVSRVGVTTREPTAAHHLRSLGQDGSQQQKADPIDLQRAMERCDKLKKQANAKFNRGDVEGARLLYSEGLALISEFSVQDDEVRLMVASLYSNRAVTFYRERILPPSVEDCDKSLELDPKSEKTYIRKWRALDAMGKMDDAIACLEMGTRELPTSSKLQDQLRRSKAPPTGPGGSSMSRMSFDMDMGRSIASMSYAFERDTIASKGGHEMDISVVGDPNHSVLERAERLKKQANAKFNKGDIEAARALYSDALGCIPKNGNYSRGVKALLSELYSNRAVTYYRNKQYQESLEDCDNAIELDPESEKSYIRKGRALVGLDRNDDAIRCMQDAAMKYPKSKKIKEELTKMTMENEENDDDDGAGAAYTKNGGGGSNDSVDFNNSVGSFQNFFVTPGDAGRSAAGGTISTGKEDLTYAGELELADKLKRNANAKFNRGDIAGARLLYTEALACLPNDRDHEAVRACLASLYANRAVTFYREKEFGPSIWDCDKAIELDPTAEKSYSRKSRALASLQRYDEAIRCLEEGKKRVSGSHKLDEELEKIRQEQGNDVESKLPLSEQTGKDFQVSYTSVDYNSSVASANFFVTPGLPKTAMGSVPEGKSQEFDLPVNENEELERAEKLKKQANAKLNKGDVAGARVLYGEGLACIAPGVDETPHGRELAASLYANRAVTFFREKKFPETVNDCNKSLELDPKHEKSYIRKWRALMALGNFEDAFKCLQGAVKELPNSERLIEELSNASEQKELLATVNDLIANGEYQEARDTLKPLVKTSDNVSLWLAAARADACLGLTESALERVDKVLMFNSKHVEALQVRGYAVFLSGEMEHGISLLKESLEGDIDTVTQDASETLQNCQDTFNAFTKGQAKVKRGRYREAVELFTSAMDDGDRIPDEAPLYGILLTERAEANLLSDQYEDALADCNEAIALKQDNMTAWTVKIEVYFAVGKLQEARDELAVVRKTWGAGNETIEDAYKKTDFELRLKKADDELHKLAALVETGVVPDDQGPLHMNYSERKITNGTTGKQPSGRPSKPSPRMGSNHKVPSSSKLLDDKRASSRSKRDVVTKAPPAPRSHSRQGSRSREGRQTAAVKS